MSATQTITIPITLDKITFRRFAAFDTFRRQKRLRLPLWFMLIMLSFATYLFFQTDKPQSGLIGGVLAAIGAGLPIAYISSFYITLRDNVKKHRLPRKVYTLRLTETDVAIQSHSNKDETLTLPWDKLHMAYRTNGAVYLYVLPGRAFLLPGGQADVPDDALWDFITDKLPAEKCRVLRRGNRTAS